MGVPALLVGALRLCAKCRWRVLVTADGVEFDKRKIVLYAYRHTYAQRHADAGVGVGVLRELMGHRELDTTTGYYHIGEDRRREAVDRVTSLQFDRHRNRLWRAAHQLLDSEHTRRAIGEVAVPFGVCTEPANVKAGGTACPSDDEIAGIRRLIARINAGLDELTVDERARIARAVDTVEMSIPRARTPDLEDELPAR